MIAARTARPLRPLCNRYGLIHCSACYELRRSPRSHDVHRKLRIIGNCIFYAADGTFYYSVFTACNTKLSSPSPVWPFERLTCHGQGQGWGQGFVTLSAVRPLMGLELHEKRKKCAAYDERKPMIPDFRALGQLMTQVVRSNTLSQANLKLLETV